VNAQTPLAFGNPFADMFRVDPNATPEQIKKKREQIANMVNGFGRARYVGEGLADLAGGVIAGRQGRKLDDAEGRGRSEGDAIFQGILSGQTGTGFNPAAPAPSAPSGGAGGWSPFVPSGKDVVSSNPGNLPTDILRAVDRVDPQGAAFTISPETRATHRPSANALNVSMDFNAVNGGGARGTEVIIPDNASPEVRAAAERYNQKVAEFAASNGIEGYPVRGVRTRSENGRGVPNTVHAEPFFNDDLDMQNAIKANPEAFASIYSDAFGNIPNARLIAPHGVGADRGAASSVFGDETTYGQTMANALLGGQAPQAPPQTTMSARGPSPQPAVARGPQPAQAGGLSMQELYTAMSNPWLTDQQRAVVGTMIQQRQQEADPMRQMQLERGRLELEQLRNPRMDDRKTAKGPDDVLRYIDTGEPVFPDVQATGGGDMTESERRIFMFNNMQAQTSPAIDMIESQGFNPSNIKDRFAEGILGGNWARSEESQMYDSAGGAWAEGALRLATGAAATPEEYNRIKTMYFAQVGDSLETIRIKQAMRHSYEEVLKATLNGDMSAEIPNPLMFAIQEYYKGRSSPPPSGAIDAPVPAPTPAAPQAASVIPEQDIRRALEGIRQSPNFDLQGFAAIPSEGQMAILKRWLEQNP